MGIRGCGVGFGFQGAVSNTVEFVRRKEIVGMMFSCDGTMV